MFLPMLLAIIAATLFASSNHIDKYLISKAVKHSDYRALILVSTLISGGIMSVIYLFVCGFNISFDLVGILLMLSNAVLTVFSLILWFKALDREDVAVVTIMLQLIPVFSLFIAPLLLADQVISPVQLVGSAIIVFAAIYITYEPSKQRIDVNRAFTLLLMVVASFMFAAQDVINRYVDQNHDFNRTILWLNLALLVMGIIIYVFIKPYRKSFNTMINNNGAKVIGLNLANEVVYSFANTIQIFASTLAPVALVSFVTQSTIPFIVMLIGIFITKFFPKIEKARGAQYEVTADGRRCSLPINDLLDFLSLSTEDLHKLSAAAPNSKIGQLTMMEFAYAASKYLSENRVLDNYVLPENLRDRMNQLLDGQLIDYYAINQLTETRDTLYEKVNINPELRKVILDQMPKDASRLEKATYIYIKMCMTLTYDNEYMVVGQTGKVAEKHKNLDYVEKISPENNEVTCSEFNIIYAKFLHELGLNFESEYKNTKGEQYGNAHASLRFRDGKFIVKADSTTRMIGGDMTNVKLWLPLVGFQCENKNKQTQDEFEESVSRMYNLVRQQEQEKMPWRKYNLLTKDGKLVGFGRKQSVFLDLLNDTQLRGVDLLAYVDQLKNVLFDEAELRENVSVIVLRNNKATDRDSGTEAGAVIALSPMNLYRRPDTTSYYYLSSNGVKTPLTLGEIQEKIDSGVFEYKKGKTARVPGTISKE